MVTTTPLKVMRTVLVTVLKVLIRMATTSLKMAIIRTTLDSNSLNANQPVEETDDTTCILA